MSSPSPAPSVAPKTKPKPKPKPAAKIKPETKSEMERFTADTTVDTIRVRSFQEAAREETMWKGSHEITDHLLWLIDPGALTPRFSQRTISISAALMKSPDEIFVNCSDQFNRTCHYTAEQGGPVTAVDVKYNHKTGRLSITNDGQGFPIAPAEALKDYDPKTMAGKWSVEVLLTREHAGTNSGGVGLFNGGIHGIGMKAVIADSRRAAIETVNRVTQTYYYQEFHGGIDGVRPPKVIHLDADSPERDSLTLAQCAPHTTITLDLDYDNLCRTGTSSGSGSSSGSGLGSWFNPSNSRNFAAFLETRCYQLAAYFACLEYRYEPDDKNPTGLIRRIDYTRTPRVTFNDRLVRVDGITEYAKMFPLAGGHHLRFSSPDMTYEAPWHIYVGLRREPGPATEVECQSFINSVFLPHGGSHITMLITKISHALAPFVIKELKIKEADVATAAAVNKLMTPLKRLLFLFDARQAPNKGFESQSKDKLTIGRAALAQMAKTYTIDRANAKKLWLIFKPALLALMTAKSTAEQLKEEVVKPRATSLGRIPNFECAELVGPKHAAKGGYFICEGKTAGSQIIAIMNTKGAPITRKYFSLYNGRGVPMTSLKHSDPAEYRDLIGQRYIPRPKLANNVVFKQLMMAIGLDYNRHYFYEPDLPEDRDPKLKTTNPARYSQIQELRAEGDRQFAELNTHRLIIAADQDVDGMGQITPLYILWIMVFWPQLLRRQVDPIPGSKHQVGWFINKLETPIVRAYPKRKAGLVKSWYDEQEFENWRLQNYGEDQERFRREWEISYYKGLGGHSGDELKNMTLTILDHIIGIRYDEAAPEVARQMYGKSSVDRKRIMDRRERIEYSINSGAVDLRAVNFSELLRRETTLFQLDFCERKLPSAIDGLVASQRKVMAGARKALAAGKKILVYQLTGKVADSQHYKHGNDAMNQTIIMMAQTFVGSNWIPILLPISNAFGNRRWGRDIVGQPRYIYLAYNADVMERMFPPEDELLLEYNTEEGTVVEPKCYCPVLPMALLTTYTTTSAGWKISSWARDFATVVKNVKQMILFDYPNPAGRPVPMLGKPWLVPGMTCEVGLYGGGKVTSEICLGEYEYDAVGNEIRITQMPLKIWSSVWRQAVLGLNEVDKEVKAIQKAKGKAKAKAKAKPKAKAGAEAGTQNGIQNSKTSSPADSDSDGEADGSGSTSNPSEPKLKTRAKALVAEVFDNTDSMSSERTDVRVILQEGAMDLIRSQHKRETERLGRAITQDPVEMYLELSMQMAPEINMMVEENGTPDVTTQSGTNQNGTNPSGASHPDSYTKVRHFHNYEEVMEHWFLRRKQLYIERLNRNRILLELRAQYYENLLRYVEADSQRSKQFNIDELEDEERYALLAKQGFVRFYHVPLFEPRRTTGEGLRELVFGPSASFDYIDNVKSYDKSAKGIAAIRKKLEDTRTKVEELRHATWQSLWEREIDDVVKHIQIGIARQWKLSDRPPKFE